MTAIFHYHRVDHSTFTVNAYRHPYYTPVWPFPFTFLQSV